MSHEESLKDVREELARYRKKQFGRNPYYVLLRFFGAEYWWSINTLTSWEKKLTALTGEKK